MEGSVCWRVLLSHFSRRTANTVEMRSQRCFQVTELTNKVLWRQAGYDLDRMQALCCRRLHSCVWQARWKLLCGDNIIIGYNRIVLG